MKNMEIFAATIIALVLCCTACNKDEPFKENALDNQATELLDNQIEAEMVAEARSVTYTFPDENQPHEGTWLQWPHQYTYGIAFRNDLDQTWVDMTAALVTSENVHIIAYNAGQKNRIIGLLNSAGVPLANVDFQIMKTDDVWVRDNGPIFVKHPNGSLRIQDWGFNGWGNKAPYRKCNPVPIRVSQKIGIPKINLNNTLKIEGGAVEVDGNGTLMATESAIINPNRNPGKTKAQINAILKSKYGVSRVLWLKGKRNADITDMHIDGFMKFANPTTIVTMNRRDLRYWQLRNTDINTLYAAKDKDGNTYSKVFLPLTKHNVRTAYGKNLGYKGSYANYYVGNTVVLVPNYIDPKDSVANNIIQGLYPGRTVIGIDVRNLYESGGMVHCVTQQQPL